MNILRPSILCIVIVLLAAPLIAQKKNNDAATPQEHKAIVWKRRVARLVDTRDTLDAKGYVYKKKYGDTVFAKLLIDEAKSGKLTLYATMEDLLSNSPISENKRKEMFTAPPIDLDTVYGTIGDSEYAYAPKRELNYQDLTKYRVLEDWEFDPVKREGEIQILGVSLLKDVFGEDDHDYRGSTATFWLKWKDIQQLFSQFMESHPGNNLQRYLWDSRFMYPGLYIDSQSASKSITEKLLTRHAIRDVEIIDTNESDWDNRHLYSATEDWTLFTEFSKLIKRGKLNAYSDTGVRFNKKLPYDKIGFSAYPEIIEIEDPITGKRMHTVINHDFNPDWFHTYSILEEWTFDPVEGKTTILLKGIEPRLDKTGLKFIRYENLFWVRYEDVIDILDHYDEYHPLNNLSTSLWRSYFKE